jgi:iron complex transport system permease protein
MSQQSRLMAALLLLCALLAMVMCVALAVGAEPISLTALRSGGVDASIIRNIRLPRVVAAALIGAVLAAAGSTFQTLLRNPLADPFILGVSGGAASAAAVAAIAGFSDVSGVMMLASFSGACAAALFVFMLARSGRSVDVARLLISGLVLNAFFSAVILLVLGYAHGGDLTAALRWMTGSLAGVGWREVSWLAASSAAMLSVLIWIASDLRLIAFGEDDAKSRGVAVDRIKVVGYFAASVATGAAVAVSGVIGFVGLLVPFLTRSLWGSDFRTNLPLSAVAGAILLTAADAVARTVAAPAELPVGALLALLGVPFFVWILRRA